MNTRLYTNSIKKKLNRNSKVKIFFTSYQVCMQIHNFRKCNFSLALTGHAAAKQVFNSVPCCHRACNDLLLTDSSTTKLRSYSTNTLSATPPRNNNWRIVPWKGDSRSPNTHTYDFRQLRPPTLRKNSQESMAYYKAEMSTINSHT